MIVRSQFQIQVFKEKGKANNLSSAAASALWPRSGCSPLAGPCISLPGRWCWWKTFWWRCCHCSESTSGSHPCRSLAWRPTLGTRGKWKFTLFFITVDQKRRLTRWTKATSSNRMSSCGCEGSGGGTVLIDDAGPKTVSREPAASRNIVDPFTILSRAYAKTFLSSTVPVSGQSKKLRE